VTADGAEALPVCAGDTMRRKKPRRDRSVVDTINRATTQIDFREDEDPEDDEWRRFRAS